MPWESYRAPLECAGPARDPPKVEDQVQFLARALIGSVPASVWDARWSSKPQGRVRFPGGGSEIRESSGCAGFAHDPAKVEDQVQFLAGTSKTFDAGARRPGDRLQPGSSGFNSHRRLSIVTVGGLESDDSNTFG